MIRQIAIGCVALVPLAFSGCGAKTADANLKEQIALMKEMDGPDDGREIQFVDIEKLVRLGEKLDKLQEQFKKFPEAEQKAAKEKYAKELAALGLDDDMDDMDEDDDPKPKKSGRPKDSTKKSEQGKAPPKKSTPKSAAPKVPVEPNDPDEN